MKTISKIMFSAVIVIMTLLASSNKAEAGTYTIGNYTFTATHCNAQNVCHDLSNQEAKDTLAYALAAHKTVYKKTLTCGNTVTLTLKSCKVTNVCSNGNSVNLNAKCKRTTTTCACGCASGVCNSCTNGGDNNGNDKDDDDTVIDPDNKCTNDDVWIEAGWSTCVNGMQSQLYTKAYDCKNVDTPSPSVTQSCTHGTPAEGEPACKYPAADGSCPPPKIDFTVNPKLISKGGSCMLKWQVEGAESCEIQGDEVDAKKGEKSVGPDETSVYKITCTNGPATASKVGLCSVQDISEQ